MENRCPLRSQKTMTRREIMEKSCKYYLDSGISIIPVGKDKKPLIQWKEYQERMATMEEVGAWLDQFPEMELGGVTGKISGIIVVDIENGGDTSWLPKTAVVQTGGGGFHYYYSYVPGMTNKVRIKDLTDIRSDGGYVILPPSITDKGPYKWLIKTQPIPFPLSLFNVTKENVSPAIDIDGYEGFGEGQRNNEMARFIGAVLGKIHPSIWNDVAWKVVVSANEKNRPPLSESELRNTFDSIANLEKRNTSDKWYKKEEVKESNEIWKNEDNKILLLSEISKKEEYSETERYSTGIDLIDVNTGGGFKDGDLIVISGASGFGKTTLTQFMSVNMASKGLPVLFFSYEVLVSHLWKKFIELWAYDDIPIYSVERNTTGNVGWIREKIKEAKEKYMIKVVAIDHLGFLVPSSEIKSSTNYSNYVGQIVRELKTIAKEERVIMLLPVHIRKTDDPGMNDLKDSSAIAQESDMVILIDKEKNTLPGETTYYTDHTKIFSVKNRSTGQNFQGWFTYNDGVFKHDPYYVPLEQPKKRYGNY